MSNLKGIHDYTIAEHPIRIEFLEDGRNDTRLLPSFAPFEIEGRHEEETLFFQLTVDDTMRPEPKERRERILRTHGHTPDSVTYHLPSENCAFVGDSIIDGNVGLTKFPGGDQPTLIRSLETRILTLPADTTLLSGHSAPLTVREFLL